MTGLRRTSTGTKLRVVDGPGRPKGARIGAPVLYRGRLGEVERDFAAIICDFPDNPDSDLAILTVFRPHRDVPATIPAHHDPTGVTLGTWRFDTHPE